MKLGKSVVSRAKRVACKRVVSSIRNPCSSGPFRRNSLEVDNPKLSFYANIVLGRIDMPSRCTNRYVRASAGRPQIPAVRGIDYDSCRRLEFRSREHHSEPLLAMERIPPDFPLSVVSRNFDSRSPPLSVGRETVSTPWDVFRFSSICIFLWETFDLLPERKQ